MKTFREIININESKKSDKLAIEIDKSIEKIDDSMSIKDFALSVSKIVKDEYGTHNYSEFIETIKKELGVK